MIRRYTTGAATGILILGIAGIFVAAASPVGTTAAAKSGTAPSTGQPTNRQTTATGPGCTVIKSDVTSGAVGLGGIYTVTAIDGQTITATAAGLHITAMTSSTGGASGGAGGGVVVVGPGGDGAPGPNAVRTSPMTVTITVGSSTVYTRADHTAGLSDVQVGSVVRVEGAQTGTTISASTIDIVLPQRTGVVTAVNGDTLTVTGFDARTYTIVDGSTTVYHRAGQAAAASDIVVGSLISAEGTSSSDNLTLTALSVTIQVPNVAGQVTAISGNTVTVKSPDDTTSTVLLTGTTTYSTGQQATASKSSITAGSFIMAEGPVGSDGSLTALLVAIATVSKDASGATCGSIALPGDGTLAGSGFGS